MNLNDISCKYSTDKNTRHSYVENFYKHKFKRFENKAIKLLEIGVHKGGSVEMWRDYFQKGLIYGVDINLSKCKLHSPERIEIIKLNAYTHNFVETAVELGKFDIIIDDGPHTFESQLFASENFKSLLSKDGILIIEDVKSTYDMRAFIELNMEIIDLTHIRPKIDDNILAVYQLGVKKITFL